MENSPSLPNTGNLLSGWASAGFLRRTHVHGLVTRWVSESVNASCQLHVTRALQCYFSYETTASRDASLRQPGMEAERDWGT
jgi:hypothetical protein